MSGRVSSVLAQATEAFFDYMQGLSPESEPVANYDNLAEFVGYWLLCGGGYSECGENFPQFLAVFALICDSWHRSPELLNFKGDHDRPAVERRVSAIFGGVVGAYNILDPFYFEYMKVDPGRER